MKLEAKQRLEAYTIHNSYEHDFLEAYPFDESKFKKISNATNDHSLEIWSYANNTEIDLRVVSKGYVVGVLQFEVHPLWKRTLPFKKLYRPHVCFTKEFAGRGIASAIYKIVLGRGYTLVTQGHTKSAALMWDRLATLPSVNSYFVNKKGRQVKPNSFGALRVLTKETL